MRYSNRVMTFCALALVALTAAPAVSKADPVTIGGGWTAFSWTSGPGAWQNETPFTFTATGSVILDVTDAFAQGDRFEVYNNGDLIGTTAQINGPANFQADPDLAFLHVGFSHGIFELAAGTYSLTFKTIQIAEGADSGQAFFRVKPDDVIISELPEPGTLALAAIAGLGFAVPGLRRLTRRRNEEPAIA